MSVTKAHRDGFLRGKSKFYIAGWVAAEGDEPMQKKPKGGAFLWESYYADYEKGYSEQIQSRIFGLSVGGNVSYYRKSIV